MRDYKGDNTVVLHDVTFLQEYNKSILVDCGTGESVVIPKSQIIYRDSDSLEIPEWLAEDRGLI